MKIANRMSKTIHRILCIPFNGESIYNEYHFFITGNLFIIRDTVNHVKYMIHLSDIIILGDDYLDEASIIKRTVQVNTGDFGASIDVTYTLAKGDRFHTAYRTIRLPKNNYLETEDTENEN